MITRREGGQISPAVGEEGVERTIKRKFGANNAKRVAAGANLLTPCFLSLRNTQTIEPTTAWMGVGGGEMLVREQNNGRWGMKEVTGGET